MKNILLLVIVWWCLQFTGKCWCYRILAICPTPANSHQLVFHAILETLAARGHELVMLTTNPVDTDNPNITQIDLSQTYASRLATENFFKTRGLNIIKMGLEDVPWIIDQSLSHPDVVALIGNHHNESFDAVFVEYIGYTPFYAFAELFNAVFIGYTTLEIDATQHEALGNAVHPAIHNPNLMGFYRATSVFRRVWNTVAFVYAKYLKVQFYARFDALIEKHFGADMKQSVELVKMVDLLFLQQNPLLGSIRPMIPTVITTSFLHIRPNKPLPRSLEHYLDSSPQGVIYFR